MSTNIKHVESAYSKGTSTFEKWQAKLDENWYRPLVRTQLAIFLKTLPEEVKARYSDEIKNLEETLGVEQPHGGKINAIEHSTQLPEPIRYQPSEGEEEVQVFP